METIEEVLLSFFEQVARKDSTLINKLISENCFSVDQLRWCFTLPDLYYFFQHQYEIFHSVDYKQFRQLVFDSPINQSTKLYGAEIIITDNRTKVDKSHYALIWPVKD